MSRRETFTGRRRRMLSRQGVVEALETRSAIGDLSSPLGMAYHLMAGGGVSFGAS